MFADMRTSDSVLSTRSRRFMRLRPSMVPVLPLIATAPRLSVWKASSAVLRMVPDLVRELPGALDFSGRSSTLR